MEWNGYGYVNSYGDVIPGAIRKGIDVSEHNGWIDWEAVKNDGIDFAIIRCGYGDDLYYQDDAYWARNVSECERLGIPYGVYIYSYAENVDMARSEANHVLRLLQGHQPSYPVYYDLEESKLESTSNRAILAEIATVFADRISSVGYNVGVYANLNWWNNYLTDPVFDKWERWVAQYNYRCDYKGSYGLWQCTSSGTVSGISGQTDINFLMSQNYEACWKESCINGKWYYVNTLTNEHAVGLKQIPAGAAYKTVLYGEDGAMLYGQQQHGGRWYHFDEVTGAMSVGLTYLADQGKTVLYGEDGASTRSRAPCRSASPTWRTRARPCSTARTGPCSTASSSSTAAGTTSTRSRAPCFDLIDIVL